MEFVCNRINFKTVMVTLTVAFFIGRINLFGGVFPAAIGFITVMLAVSTIYIYTLPVIALSIMLSYVQMETTEPYGDIIALGSCAVVFLFFHKQKLTINQRTLIAASITVICRCGYSLARFDLLSSGSMDWIALGQEIIALAIYIRVLNASAAALLAPGESTSASGGRAGLYAREKIGMSLALLAVSMTGAIGEKTVVFGIWFFFIAVTAYCRDFTFAITVSAICDVFWRCMTGTSSSVFTSIYLALIIARFLVAAFEVKYRKYVLALILLGCVVLTTKTFDYSIAVSMSIFAAMPGDILARVWHTIERVISPDEVKKEDEKLLNLKRHLRTKRELFRSLSRMCYEGDGNQKVMACQFEALARVTDRFIDESRGENYLEKNCRDKDIKVAIAGYAMGHVSGDSALNFSFDGNKQGLLLSDGMGKGDAAAPVSQMVVSTLSKLLKAGFDIDLALKTVNEMLMAENDGEMFASLDMTVINKSTRRAHIFKMGASSTFVKHNGKVAIIKKPAPPVGVASALELEYLDFRLDRGDVLVMVSDGVSDCDRNDRECGWLIERLTEIGSSDPGVIAELIINKAVEKYGIKERDDLTVLVAVV